MELQLTRRFAWPVGIVLIVLIGAGFMWWQGRSRSNAIIDPPPQTGPQYGGVYRRGLRGEPVTLDPALVKSIYEVPVVQQVFDGLVQFDANLNVVPSIAQSWKASPNGLLWTFYLRKDVKFHNGRSVVADDVIYSFTRIVDPQTGSHRRQLFEQVMGAKAFAKGKAQRIEGFKALDSHTLQIELSQPYAPFIRMLGVSSAKVVPKEAAEGAEGAFGHAPVGTGAFRFVSWKAGEAITLEANEAYFEKRPYLDKIEYRIFPGADLQAIFDEFEKGHLDDAKVLVPKRQQLKNDPRFQFVRQPLLATLFLWMDYREGPLRDVRVRRAINLAIDRSHIVKDIRKNRFAEAHGVLPPGLLAYNPELPAHAYDVEKAKQLLIDAGYPGGKGLPPLEFWSSVKGPTPKLEHEAIKGFLAQIGIQLDVKTAKSWKQFSSEILGKRPGIMFRYAWYASFPDPDEFLYVLFHSKGPYNRGHYSNPEVDRLLEKARFESDDLKRIDLYRKAEKLIIADVPTLDLVHYAFERLFHPYVRGIAANSLGESYIPMKTIWLDTAQHGYPKTARAK